MHVWVVIRVERLISVSLASGLLKAPGLDASSILVTRDPQSVFSGGHRLMGNHFPGTRVTNVYSSLTIRTLRCVSMAVFLSAHPRLHRLLACAAS